MQSFYVYILQCSDGSYYVGHTDSIYLRLEQHIETNIENSGYVSKRLPAKVVYVECTDTRQAAQEFERQLKGWSRKKKEAFIAGGFQAVQQLRKKEGPFDTASTAVRPPLREHGGKALFGSNELIGKTYENIVFDNNGLKDLEIDIQ